MLHWSILSRRIDNNWVYTLIEYDLAFEPSKTLKGQIFIDFSVEHRIDVEDEINYVTCTS